MREEALRLPLAWLLRRVVQLAGRVTALLAVQHTEPIFTNEERLIICFQHMENVLIIGNGR